MSQRHWTPVNGYFCTIHQDWFHIRETMRLVHGRVVCLSCYKGHAKCRPRQCILHAADWERDPNNWRQMAQNLQGGES